MKMWKRQNAKSKLTLLRNSVNDLEEDQIELELPTKEQMAENLKVKADSKTLINSIENEEEISEAVKETLLEEPVLIDYAANNYWRKDMLSEINELEKDYD